MVFIVRAPVLSQLLERFILRQRLGQEHETQHPSAKPASLRKPYAPRYPESPLDFPDRANFALVDGPSRHKPLHPTAVFRHASDGLVVHQKFVTGELPWREGHG